MNKYSLLNLLIWNDFFSVPSMLVVVVLVVIVHSHSHTHTHETNASRQSHKKKHRTMSLSSKAQFLVLSVTIEKCHLDNVKAEKQNERTEQRKWQKIVDELRELKTNKWKKRKRFFHSNAIREWKPFLCMKEWKFRRANERERETQKKIHNWKKIPEAFHGRKNNTKRQSDEMPCFCC